MSAMADIVLILIVLFVVGLGAAISIFYIKKSGVDRMQSEAIRDLERRLTDLMQAQLKEIRGSVDGTSRAMNQQIRSFTQEATQIREELKQVGERIKDVSSFQEIFKSPKLRGQWGEASLEHILSQHYPRELYKIQHSFSSGEHVDAILMLPNKKILPIDAKFSSDNFEKMVYAKTEEERESFRKSFTGDLKIQIDSIAEKYIIPSEDTVDFALMYIPAEAIYYEIINNVGQKFDLARYAWQKHVILTSPNTIYLTLRTIEHWFRDTQISRRTQEILKRLARIYSDGERLAESFRKLGKHLNDSHSAFNDSEKRLSLMGGRVERLMEMGDVKKLKKGDQSESDNITT